VGAEFDLLMIDEASQMRPEEALGALARAKHVIVVGDPMQLPPTRFFDRSIEIDDDDDFTQERVANESILDRALAVYQPARDLRWHYRSRHSSLIDFSNRKFYHDRLLVFPSPNEEDARYGVHLREVNGFFRGGTNAEEAGAIATEALRFMRERPGESLGIVAMNQKQQALIREELDRAIAEDTTASNYVRDWQDAREGLEPLFVKNLENVQGDERDVIFISTVYGPEELGKKVYQRFGPVNGAAGHRRLNVLFTRAKHQVVVFTSMKPNDVEVHEKSHRGVSVLRDYLEYAATGRLETGISPEPRPQPESPLEEMVIERIEAIGCTAVPQVGVGGFRIDIGIRHPDYPYGFLMGVECDGASYHSAASVRDRDRLRQTLLRV
jgi:superfamily I DNA and/or RNA helicase